MKHQRGKAAGGKEIVEFSGSEKYERKEKQMSDKMVFDKRLFNQHELDGNKY